MASFIRLPVLEAFLRFRNAINSNHSLHNMANGTCLFYSIETLFLVDYAPFSLSLETVIDYLDKLYSLIVILAASEQNFVFAATLHKTRSKWEPVESFSKLSID